MALSKLALAISLSVATVALAAPAHAQSRKSAPSLGGSMKGLLGNASDSALDQLGRPGAFYADQAVRILLPGPLQKATKLLRLRSAIDSMTLADGVGIVAGGDTAGTQYLRRTSGEVLRQKMRPLVSSALGRTGAFKQLDSLGKGGTGGVLGALAGVDLSRDGLIDSVTDQAMSGIFTYIGREEADFRRNPLKSGKKLLDRVM
ncbi:DUF4197 domain-containing protein [Blastomonas sp.]|uniref:DUF4197 domain-containing protein n=1 Tax=Blastomonas sp. TaxID=1909299 RepID=UPI00406A966B